MSERDSLPVTVMLLDAVEPDPSSRGARRDSPALECGKAGRRWVTSASILNASQSQDL